MDIIIIISWNVTYSLHDIAEIPVVCVKQQSLTLYRTCDHSVFLYKSLKKKRDVNDVMMEEIHVYML